MPPLIFNEYLSTTAAAAVNSISREYYTYIIIILIIMIFTYNNVSRNIGTLYNSVVGNV